MSLKNYYIVTRVESSAYITYLNVLLDSGKSFMYITKISGPIMEPCGIPVVKGRVSEMLLLYVTHCFLFFKELSVSSRAMAHIPYTCHLFNNILWFKSVKCS